MTNQTPCEIQELRQHTSTLPKPPQGRNLMHWITAFTAGVRNNPTINDRSHSLIA